MSTASDGVVAADLEHALAQLLGGGSGSGLLWRRSASGRPAAARRRRRRRQQLGHVRRIRRRGVDVGVEGRHPRLLLDDAGGHLHAVHVLVVRVLELDQQIADDRVLDARLDLGHQVLIVEVAGHRIGLSRRRLEVGGRKRHHLLAALLPHGGVVGRRALQEAPRGRPDVERLVPVAAGLHAGDVLVEHARHRGRHARHGGRLRRAGGARDQRRRGSRPARR